MSMRYKGGVISATPPTVTISSATGLWTMQDQMRYQAAGTWPPSVVPDPYFENVIGLFHFDGTNGAQNNTFLDSSTNAFSITRNGNTTQGSFSPFSRAAGNWSNYFDGSGDNLTVASNAAFTFGTGDWTIEVWLYLASDQATADGVFDLRPPATNGLYPAIVFNTGNTLGFYVNGVYVITSSALAVGQWYHVAVARSGTSTKMFVNGVQSGSTYTDTNNYLSSTATIGTLAGLSTGYDFTGYISNLRVVKGTAVYTAAFTPPTTPLTAIANTSLLTCQSNRFIDNSTNAFAITVNGNTSVQVFNPFNPTTAYSTTTNGGSGYFDGSGDYLTTPNNAAFSPSGDFTIEAWVYVTNASNSYYRIMCSGINNSSTNWSFNLSNLTTTRTVSLYLGSTTTLYTSTASIIFGQWNHVAVSRSGSASNNLKVFVNGVGTSFSTTASLSTGANVVLAVGADSGGTDALFNGYISGARIVNGTGLYTADFTPPTAPPTAITNTSLLLNFTNAGAFDSAAIEDYETVGSSQLSTTQFKFGTSSLVLNGTTTNFQNTLRGATTSDNFKLGTGPFTIEGFLRLNSSTISYPYVWNLYNPGTSTSVLTMFFGDAGYSYNLLIYYNSNLINVNNAASRQSAFLNTWKHFAFVRDSASTFTVYVDGVSVYTTTLGTDLGTAKLHFGNYGDGSTYGYLDEFRITKGVARYTANFTPPTAAFPNL